MKNIFFRMSVLGLLLTTLLASCVACTTQDTTDVNITTNSDVTTTSPETLAETDIETTPQTEVETEAPKSYITINVANASSAKIIRSDSWAKYSTEMELFAAFRNEINKRMGVTFSLGTDYKAEDSGFEIIVGESTRGVSVELQEKINTAGLPAYGILAKENKIAVCGSNVYLVYKGLDYLMESFITNDESGKPQLKIEDGFELIEKNDTAYPDPEELINSGKELAFYSIEKLATVPTKGNFSVLQGGGSDGKYAYYAMINKSTTPETAIIYKYDIATWELVANSKSMPSAHTNDITYDSKNHRLVISYCSAEDGYLGLVFVNPDTLEFIEYIKSPTANRGVCYLPERNQYLFATSYTFHLTDENFNTISSTTCGYPELTTQGFYCDGKYIYDPRWKSGAKYQTITINTLDGQFIGALELHNIDGEPENIFRDGNSFVMGCNKSDAVFRLALLYKGWWN